MALPNLIYDRTQVDADLWQMLSTKLDTVGWTGLSSAEQAQWLTQLKGCYNHTDLNRVGAAVSYLGEEFSDLISHLIAYRGQYGVASAPLFELPYTAQDITISPKTDWAITDDVTAQQTAQYLQNLVVLRSLITLPKTAPPVPTDMESLTIIEANQIEELLHIIDATLIQLTEILETQIYNTSLAWFFSGEVFSQEV